jgi:hypothetical protein
MQTIEQQQNATAIGKVRCLPMDWKGNIAPDFVVAMFGPLVVTALPAPDAEIVVETYRGWPITWESGYGFAAQLSCHVDDCVGWCDTIEEIRAEIDGEIEDRRRSYGAHFHEDTPSLDDTFHRIEMDV